MESVIAEYVSSLFVTRVSDPRLRPLNVTRAKVSPDMRRAYVYYSVLGGEDERASAEKALRKAAGFVRSSLGGALPLRHVPEVVFLYDRNPVYAQRVMEILAEGSSLVDAGAGREGGPGAVGGPEPPVSDAGGPEPPISGAGGPETLVSGGGPDVVGLAPAGRGPDAGTAAD
jgi:ribosome-binding factor A